MRLVPLIDAGLEVINPTHQVSEDEVVRLMSDAAAYLLGGDEYIGERALTDSPVKVIAFLGVGYESCIDFQATQRQGIIVTSTPGTLTDSVAEFTIGQLLNATRRLTAYTNDYRAGIRGREEKRREISAMTIGIIGLGPIGLRIAEALTFGFGADLRYYSRTRRPAEEARLGIRYDARNNLATECDAVILMTACNPSTIGLINKAFFDNAKPGLILVNTAHPRLVDAGSLSDALRRGVVETAVYDHFYDDETGAALLDEFDEDRLLVTGHIASLTEDARGRMATMAVSSILNVLRTGDDPHVVRGRPRTI
jgi:glyoxylate reductase